MAGTTPSKGGKRKHSETKAAQHEARRKATEWAAAEEKRKALAVSGTNPAPTPTAEQKGGRGAAKAPPPPSQYDTESEEEEEPTSKRTKFTELSSPVSSNKKQSKALQKANLAAARQTAAVWAVATATANSASKSHATPAVQHETPPRGGGGGSKAAASTSNGTMSSMASYQTPRTAAAAASTSNVGSSGGGGGTRKPTYETKAPRRRSAAFNSPKPAPSSSLSSTMGRQVPVRTAGAAGARVHMPNLPDDAVPSAPAVQVQAAVAGAVDHAAAPVVAGESIYKALTGFLIVVLGAFFVSGLYEQGAITGHVFGGGGPQTVLAQTLTNLETKCGHTVTWWQELDVLSALVGSSSTNSSSSSSITTTPPCFRDSPTENEDDTYTALADYCANVPAPSFLFCPKDAHCSGGVMEYCHGKHYDIAPTTKDHCLLTVEANNTIAAMVEQLHEWTVQDSCSWGQCAYTVDRTPDTDARPLFNYAQLVGDLELPWDYNKLTQAANAQTPNNKNKQVFSTARQGDLLLIGLHADQPLRLSAWCMLKMCVFVVLGVLLSAVWMLVRVLAAWIFDLTFGGYPMISTICALVGFLVLVALHQRGQNQRYKQELRNDVVKVRTLALVALADRKENQALFVRDKVAFDLYPAHKKGRDYLCRVVWPHVVGDIQQDNRVSKRTVVTDDGTRAFWKWVSSSDPPPHVHFVE